jgi:hypothetical protein
MVKCLVSASMNVYQLSGGKLGKLIGNVSALRVKLGLNNHNCVP